MSLSHEITLLAKSPLHSNETVSLPHQLLSWWLEHSDSFTHVLSHVNSTIESRRIINSLVSMPDKLLILTNSVTVSGKKSHFSITSFEYINCLLKMAMQLARGHSLNVSALLMGRLILAGHGKYCVPFLIDAVETDQVTFRTKVY